jgi:4-amino-4-deoxy-L-arabinose transferase-like glycosyltransferase
MLALATALLAEHTLFVRQQLPEAVALYAVAAGLLILAVGHQAVGRLFRRLPLPIRGSGGMRRGRFTLATAGLCLAAGNAYWLHIKGLTQASDYWINFAAWLVAIGLYGGATLLPANPGRRASEALRALMGQLRSDAVLRRESALVGLLLLMSAGLRFYKLGSIPDIIDGDEGDQAMRALEVANGMVPDMFGTWKSYGILYLHLMGVSLRLLGHNAVGIRLWTAVGGVLAVLFVYLLGRRMFGMRAALLAATWLAVAHTHVHFSRVMFGNQLDTVAGAATLYFLYRGLTRGDSASFILSGTVLGLAQYLYIGARLLVVVVGLNVLLLLVVRRHYVLVNIRGLALMAGAIFVVAAPVVRWALDHSDQFTDRLRQMGVLQSNWLWEEAARRHQPEILVLVDQLWTALLTLIYHPMSWFYGADLPMFDPMTGGLLILGLVYGLLRWRDPRTLMLNTWFWSGLIIGGALLVNTHFSAYRIIGIMPPAMLLAVLVTLEVARFASAGLSRRAAHIVGATVLVTVTALLAVANLRYYFGIHIAHCKYMDDNTARAALIGSYLRSADADVAYFVGHPHMHVWAYRSIAFLSGDRPVSDIQNSVSGPLPGARPGDRIAIIFMPERISELVDVRFTYPNGQQFPLRRCGRRLLTVYEVTVLPSASQSRLVVPQ